MHADELRMAVTKIVALLEKAQIASVVDQYRSSKGDQRTIANARLRQSSAILMESFDHLTAVELQVCKIMHLESLGSPNYWLELFSSVSDVRKHQGEIVRLASRIMFASSHLPGFVNLLEAVKPTPAVSGVKSEKKEAGKFESLALARGEAHLCIRLTDAGERASDPDRIARSIDGLDMLYSACASVARQPAIELRLEKVVSKRNGDRDLVLTGESDSVMAVYSVIDSIPAVLAALDPEQDLNLDTVVRSLPIFEDLNTLASLGTFSKHDLKDISDTMHQGALLTLESGVIPVDPEDLEEDAGHPTTAGSAATNQAVSSSGKYMQANAPSESLGDEDEHYERYLKEREAMLRSQGDASAAPVSSANPATEQKQGAIDQSRRDAVDDLLKSLGQSRSH